MLLGIPGDNTFSNYQEANRTFWRSTVLPLTQRLVSGLGGWLAPGYGALIRLDIDLDGLDALAPERDALWTRLEKATFLTNDEKRTAAGYGTGNGPASSNCVKFDPNQPRDVQGRWRSDGEEGDSGDPGVVPIVDRSYNVDILKEDRRDPEAHTYRDHVGKSDEAMTNRVRSSVY